MKVTPRNNTIIILGPDLVFAQPRGSSALVAGEGVEKVEYVLSIHGEDGTCLSGAFLVDGILRALIGDPSKDSVSRKS